MTTPTVSPSAQAASPTTPESLAAAVERWGLDVVPPSPENPVAASITPTLSKLAPAQRRRVTKLVNQMGTPLDIVRGMMAKQVPPEWERDLRTISPVSDTASYLIFAWKQPPLEPERGRWCVYEAIPDALISAERRMELDAAPYWALPTADARQAQAQIVSGYQWAMYRDHRVDVRPFWCLQGSESGTPMHLTHVEKRYLRMMRKPDFALPVGDLPFAPWDGRARAAILERDRLVKFGGSVERLRSSGDASAQRAAVEEQERAYRRAFWDWFGEKLGPATELYAYILKHESPDRERQSEADAIAAAEARDHFIETGRVPDPHQYRNRRLQVAR